METMKIKAIVSAVKSKSLSRAAEEFSYTPSALSHMADSFESELGVKILNRTRTGVELTEEGRLLYPSLVSLLSAEEQLTALAGRIRSGEGSELRIGTYSSISTYLLPEILRLFKDVHPEIRVSITVSDYLRGWLENGSADIVFADESSLGENEKILIGEDRYIAILPSGFLPARRTVKREELYAFPYISTNESALHMYFDESRFRGILNIDSTDYNSVISMVREGIGVAVLPSLVSDSLPRGVKAMKLLPCISRTLGFGYKHLGPAAEKFVEFTKGLSIGKLRLR